jgi:outer membrane autotransporter barrel domain
VAAAAVGGLYVGAAAGVTTTVINNASITGGNGGQGGSSLGFPNGNGGNAGGGGVGVNLDGNGITLINAGTISGGNGGVGGQVNTQFGTPFGVNGLSGDGGVAVTANGGSTIINSGTITGGASGYGYRADAIDLSGGANTVVIEAGSQIVGNVVSSSGNSNGGDHLALGGDVDALGGNVFDASQLGTQYQGFSGYTKTGTSTWTLTGTSASPSTAWNLAEGTLAIASGASLGSGTLTFSGGTLDVTGSTSLGQSLVASGGPANILLDNNATLTLGGVISGTGSVVQRGNGTLSLTGSNTYTGGTDVQSGSLSVGSSTALGAGDVSFADGTRWLLAGNGIDIGNRVNLSGHVAVDVAAGTSDSIGGSIDDGHQAGALTKTGAGTLVLSGVNGYTGETTISAGVLQLGNGGTTGSLAGNIVDDATLALNRSDDLTLTNDISGAGALIQRGSGTVTLAGNNSYAGGTVVQSGGLGVTSAASLGSGNVSLADGARLALIGNGIDLGNQVVIAGNAAVAVDTGTSSSLGGAIDDGSQAGALTKTGGGTLVLHGASGYSGGTTISAGVLQLGNGGTSGSVVGNIIDNATLALDHSDDLTFGNDIGGSGAVVQRGSGTVTLTGNNSYAGGTVVQSGGLGVTSSASLGTGSVTIADGARLVFDGSGIGLGNQVLMTGNASVDVAAGASDTLNGAIGDGAQAGTLTKTGAGTLILNGSNDYTGGTNIALGTLEVGDSDHPNASIAGPVSVGADGTLRGHGRIDGDVVSDGVVWPGASIGTLTINGNYTQRGDGRLIVDVSPTDASQLVVSGKATLGGSLQVVFAPGTYTSRDIALIKAASVDGTFADVSYSGAVPTGQAVTYDANQVNLYLALASVAPLDASLFGNLMRAQNLAGQQVLDTTLDVSGQLATCNGAASSADGPARDCRSGAWAQYSGGGISLSGDERLNSSAFGVLAGYDIAVGDAFHIGVEGGYNRINGSDNPGGSGHVNSTHGGLYAFANAGPLVISGSVDQTHSRYAFQRQSGAGVEASRPGGSTTSAGVRVAWPVQAGNWTIAPSIGALYQHQSMDSFSESTSSTSALAAAFLVDGTRSHFDSLQPFARLRLGHDFEAAGVHYSAAWDLGYAYAARHDTTPSVDVITQDGSLFTVAGQPIGKGMATVGARISAQVGASWSAYAAYQGQFARHADNQALTLGLRKAF